MRHRTDKGDFCQGRTTRECVITDSCNRITNIDFSHLTAICKGIIADSFNAILCEDAGDFIPGTIPGSTGGIAVVCHHLFIVDGEFAVFNGIVRIRGCGNIRLRVWNVCFYQCLNQRIFIDSEISTFIGGISHDNAQTVTARSKIENRLGITVAFFFDFTNLNPFSVLIGFNFASSDVIIGYNASRYAICVVWAVVPAKFVIVGCPICFFLWSFQFDTCESECQIRKFQKAQFCI